MCQIVSGALILSAARGKNAKRIAAQEDMIMKRSVIMFATILVAVQAIAYSTEVVDGIKWEYMIKGNEAILVNSAVPEDTKGDITIPSALGGYPIKRVSDMALAGRRYLTGVTIPSGMMSIGEHAFSGCENMASVTIPSSVSSIGEGAFYGCGGLTSVSMPSNVTSIADYVFCGCSRLESLIIPSSITSIGEHAFDSCKQLKSITIPSGVASIGAQAFSHCTRLESVAIPSSVTSIGKYAFEYCNWLSKVYVDDGDTARMKDVLSENASDINGWAQFIEPSFVPSGDNVVVLCTTNVVVHYMTTNVPVEVVAPISSDTGIVNVMTEVQGGNVAIPDSWAKGFPSFETQFGSNFTDALTKQTGKYDCNKTPMLVWQDYVAGTDPTNPDDTFSATITMVGGVPQVQWKPVLTDEAAAKRVYTKYGKVKLTDEWAEIPSGHEADYNFFKVTVKMK